ncbi:MAG: hypothetical protein ACE5K0_01635 [Candidatus Methanofastidiosia archaeon]
MQPDLSYVVLMEQKMNENRNSNRDIEKICLRDGKISVDMIPPLYRPKPLKKRLNLKIAEVKRVFRGIFNERVL